MALQIRGNTQIMQASVSLDRLDSNGGSLHGAVTINSLSSSNATITGGSASGLSNVGSVAGTFSGLLTHTGDSAGVKFSSPFVDINGGTIDNVTIATSDITVGAGKTLDLRGIGNLFLDNDAISGDKVDGGTIASIAITSVDINGGTIDNTSYTAGTGSVNLSGKTTDSGLTIDNDAISGDKISGGSLSGISVDGSLNLQALDSSGALTINNDMISGNSIHGGDISGNLDLSGDEIEVKTGKFTAGSGGFIVDSIGNATMRDLTVTGTTTTVNSEIVNLADNFILLNSDLDSAGNYGFNSGIEIKRDANDNTNVKLEWDETADRWTVGSETFVAGEFIGDLTGDVTGDLIGDIKYANGNVLLDQSNATFAGNSNTASAWQASRTFTFKGDVAGSMTIDGSSNLDSVGLTIQPQSLEFSMLSSNAYLSVDSGADSGWDGASDSQLVTALDVKQYVDNSTSTGLAAEALSFKIGTGSAMTNVKYQIEDVTVSPAQAGTETVDLSVAVVSSYETLADVYMNGQKLRYGSDNSSGDFYFGNDDAGARKRINFNSINLESGDVIEVKYFINE